MQNADLDDSRPAFADRSCVSHLQVLPTISASRMHISPVKVLFVNSSVPALLLITWHSHVKVSPDFVSRMPLQPPSCGAAPGVAFLTVLD